MADSDLKKIFSFIDQNQKAMIDLLKEAVAIKSVSTCIKSRPDVVKMVEWVAELLKKEGVKVELRDVGVEDVTGKQKLKLPPVLLGQLGDDSTKKTICIYGHLDVQSATVSDGWNTDPFVLTEKDDKLYGRGASDDKGPVMGWIFVLRAFNSLGIKLPVNLKFCFEAMEESGSEGLEQLLVSQKNTFLKGVNYICISDGGWFGTKKPCVEHGLRGFAGFEVEIECAQKDLHSGIFGGIVYEAMVDLMAVMSKLVESNGKILIPGIMDDVSPVSDEERERYTTIDFDPAEYKQNIGNENLRNSKKEDVLMAGWRFPSLSIHGVQGAFSDVGFKTIIPGKVIGKFSMRLVPNQKPDKIEKLVLAHLNKCFAELKSGNIFRAKMFDGTKPWLANPKDENYTAGAKAIERVYGVKPDLVRSGGSIPVTLIMQEITGKSALLLPMGAGDDNEHAQNEKMNKVNYIQGTKVFAAYFFEIASA